MFYPNIHCLLKITATIPVTTASAERSFRCLRRLKSYLRSTMGQDRLSGLAMLNLSATVRKLKTS
ncbi:52 kDa repressor of the inhibitor of the protein kinase [Acipenser ruthenus]|uniref:52 kDa repressor of the inhibitor of the protein kinase n=1 Tax=Acipenser ruthenus TaxID=7906 RepID=A0A444UC30_ACIRT|nr:52 kDa repressor of the inhibitor of the protein kinase [Acipenser ruthenus]